LRFYRVFPYYQLMKAWLTTTLKEEVRKVFEDRYKRALADQEVIEIANNLTGFIELYAKSKYGKQNI
jgi:predicted house-cleaning noncanonical NTP pyrophosphatase (MazG superfamily)